MYKRRCGVQAERSGAAGTKDGGVIGNGKETERKERGEKREERQKEGATAVGL